MCIPALEGGRGSPCFTTGLEALNPLNPLNPFNVYLTDKKRLGAVCLAQRSLTFRLWIPVVKLEQHESSLKTPGRDRGVTQASDPEPPEEKKTPKKRKPNSDLGW